ncbi:FUSC family protein [Corynebacterium breve]|uniref:FUSC family protein n=1 Tax=Corynebacterium breve TaxID=3049799 RepID=A0ABY8VCM1_9CORY|nr:FUSC family protein [Corynebacterium breve]WIM67421.1 FUSC family protein [Corynebacterium breve]
MAKQRMGTLARLEIVDRSLQSRLSRVKKRLFSIFQAALAAGLAYWVASRFVGHELPFFAPIAVVIILGLSGGGRINRAFEMSLGCVLGVLLGDLLFVRLGSGAWQIAIAVAGSLLVASFFSKSQLVSNQVAIGSILIATIMPPGAETTGIDRTVDAIIGSVIALSVIAVLPASPLVSGRYEISNVLGLSSSVLDDVAKGLRTKDSVLIDEAIHAIQGSDSQVDAMLAATRSGAESTKISPLLWGARRYVRSLERVVGPVDSAVRNVRVLARRAMVLVRDNDTVSEQQVEIIDDLAKISLELSEIYDVKTELNQAQEIPILVNELRVLGAKASLDVLDEDSVLSAYAILAQSRSIIVDLLEICGMSRESANAVLAPTSETPAFPPELHEE